jgi:hypothetical protein
LQERKDQESKLKAAALIKEVNRDKAGHDDRMAQIQAKIADKERELMMQDQINRKIKDQEKLK